MSSINFQSYALEQVSWSSPRIGVGKVLEIGSYRFPGSPEAAAQGDGESLGFYRVAVQRGLKGEGLAAGQELRIFSPQAWFRHTHAAAIRGGVISYSDPHYAGELILDQISPGTDILFYLGESAVPAGFPPGAVFLAMDGALDRADRDAEVLTALKEGPYASFDHRILLKVGGRVRLPDGLEIRLGASSHKRPRTGGPQCESTHLTLSKDGVTGSLQLNHVVKPDESQSWGKGGWGAYTVDLLAMGYDRDAEIVVRKA